MTAALPPHIIPMFEEARESRFEPFKSIIDKVIEEGKKDHDKEKQEAEQRIKEETKLKEKIVRDGEEHRANNEASQPANEGAELSENSEDSPTDEGTGGVLQSGSNGETEESNGQSLDGGSTTSDGTIQQGLSGSWDNISPRQAAEFMSERTGISSERWEAIIFAESTNNPYVVNSIGCIGYLQLHPVHGVSLNDSPETYLNKAVEIFHTQGIEAWEVTTKGMA